MFHENHYLITDVKRRLIGMRCWIHIMHGIIFILDIFALYYFSIPVSFSLFLWELYSKGYILSSFSLAISLSLLSPSFSFFLSSSEKKHYIITSAAGRFIGIYIVLFLTCYFSSSLPLSISLSLFFLSSSEYIKC